MENKTAEEIYESNRPKFYEWGTLKDMCLASMEEYASLQCAELKKRVENFEETLEDKQILLDAAQKGCEIREKKLQEVEAERDDWMAAHTNITEFKNKYISELQAENAELKKERDDLKQWKEVEIRTWEPLINWFQLNRTIPPGTSLLETVLHRVTEHENLQAENESLKKRVEELESGCKELMRFKPSLMHLIQDEFQYPDSAIACLMNIESTLHSIS